MIVVSRPVNSPVKNPDGSRPSARKQVDSAVLYSMTMYPHRRPDKLAIVVFLALLSIRPAWFLSSEPPKRKPRPRIPILRYEDDWVCINKPTGMTVHRSKNTRRSEPVVTTSLKRQLSRKVLPIHRLDHRTSGAMLLAFDSATAATMQTALTNANKTYFALVRGDWDQLAATRGQDSVRVDKPLKIHDVEKEAVTIFRKLASVSCDQGVSCSLITAHPQTGRTHQIRRHAFYLGIPILGDSEHGDTRVNRLWRNQWGLNRLALHCLSVEILLYGKEEKIVAPVPENLKSVLNSPSLARLWSDGCSQESSLSTDWIDKRGGTLGFKKSWQNL